MNDRIKKDLEELKERYMSESGMDKEAQYLSDLMSKLEAERIERARLQEADEAALSKKLESQAIQKREEQGQQDAEKQKRAMRMAEYEKEMEDMGFANKSKYQDLFPEQEISPMEEEKKRKKMMGF